MLEKIGVTTKKRAKELGYTHEGNYYGIPIWIKDIEDDDSGIEILPKWSPMERAIDFVAHLEGLFRDRRYPEDDPCFQFAVKGEI